MVRIPNHVVCDLTHVAGDESHVGIDFDMEVVFASKTAVDLIGMQSMLYKLLEKSSLVYFLVGLIEAEICIVFLGGDALVETVVTFCTLIVRWGFLEAVNFEKGCLWSVGSSCGKDRSYLDLGGSD